MRQPKSASDAKTSVDSKSLESSWKSVCVPTWSSVSGGTKSVRQPCTKWEKINSVPPSTTTRKAAKSKPKTNLNAARANQSKKVLNNNSSLKSMKWPSKVKYNQKCDSSKTCLRLLMAWGKTLTMNSPHLSQARRRNSITQNIKEKSWLVAAIITSQKK